MPTAVVTGASTGIGRAIAERLAGDGFKVVVNSKHDVEGGTGVVESIERAGGAASYFQADVSSASGAQELIAFASRQYEGATVLVNNAGATRPAEYGSWDVDHWHDMLDTNLVTTAMMSQAFTEALAADEEGAIVNVASIRGLAGHSRIGAAAYSAAKAGVISLTGALARALAPRVRVNAISPGFVETAYMSRTADELKASWKAGMPIGRFIDPSEIAAAAAFLVAQPAITGANLVVDGGWTQAAA